jgi:hypothetical protein
LLSSQMDCKLLNLGSLYPTGHIYIVPKTAPGTQGLLDKHLS